MNPYGNGSLLWVAINWFSANGNYASYIVYLHPTMVVCEIKFTKTECVQSDRGI